MSPAETTSGTTVLIVEDNPLLRRVLRETLHSCSPSLAICEASTLAEGRRKLLECGPNVVVLDIRLPDGNGLDLAEQIRRDLPSARVVVWTSYGIPEYRETARRRGVTQFLCKERLDWNEIRALVGEKVRNDGDAAWQAIPGAAQLYQGPERRKSRILTGGEATGRERGDVPVFTPQNLNARGEKETENEGA